MAKLVMFCILAVVVLGSAVMSVCTKSIMRAATWLLFVLFGIAGFYFILDYTFLGAAQISIYAGGITVMYVFAIQLVSKHSLQNLVARFKGTRVAQGLIISLVGLVVLSLIIAKNHFVNAALDVADLEVPMKQVGQAMVGSGKYGYVLPFVLGGTYLLVNLAVSLDVLR